MNRTHALIAFATALKAFRRHRRAYFARPDLLTVAHDEQMYYLARRLAHEAKAAGLID